MKKFHSDTAYLYNAINPKANNDWGFFQEESTSII